MTHHDKRKGTNRGTEGSQKQGTGSVTIPTLHGDSLVGSTIFSISFMWKCGKLELTTDWCKYIQGHLPRSGFGELRNEGSPVPKLSTSGDKCLRLPELKAENRQHTYTLQSTQVRVQPTVNTGSLSGPHLHQHPYKNHDALAWGLPSNKCYC